MRFPIVASALAMLVSSAAAQEAVTVNFAADIGGKPFACAETYPSIDSTNTIMSVTDFRLFISDPALIRADGSLFPIALDQDGQWQFENAVLLGLEDATAACSTTGTAPTNTSLRGTFEPGDYVGLSFEIGLPFTGMPALLNSTGMFWSWQTGFPPNLWHLIRHGERLFQAEINGDSIGWASPAELARLLLMRRVPRPLNVDPDNLARLRVLGASQTSTGSSPATISPCPRQESQSSPLACATSCSRR